VAVSEGQQEAESLPLAPPPGAFESEQSCAVSITLRAEPTASYRVSFHPLRVGEQTEALLALATPVETAAKQDQGQRSATELHDLLLRFRGEMAQQFRLNQLIGTTPVMARVRQQVQVASASAANVLIVGEPGCGRQLLAKTIHYAHAGQSSSLAPIACPITDAEMLQAAVKAFIRRREELQRHEDRETAPGTLLLIDVDRLPADAQHELVGFLKLPDFQVRLISTARQSLPELAAADCFDQSLAYQLSTHSIALPGLRERRADIPLLAQHFLEQTNLDDASPPHSGFDDEAIDLLMQYDWPQNLPQLAAAVSEACERATRPIVSANDLPVYLAHAAEASKHTDREPEPIELDAFLENIESELIQQALRHTSGNKTKAAVLLGISRARMIRRVQHFGLEPGIDFEEIQDE
jgi:DNA-binding NtrC family response regulator